MRDRFLLIAFLVILLVFGLLLGRKFYLSQAPEGPVVLEPSTPSSSQREVLLYFAVADAPYLEAEIREIEDCQVEQDCVYRTVQALIDGPIGNLAPVIPRQTVLRQVVVDGDLVVVDFSRDFVTGHPGGSLSELLTVYSLVDSLAVNFPYVRQLRIQAEGESLETIKGHVDLRAPITADFSYTRTSDPQGSLPLPLLEEGVEERAAAENPANPVSPR